MSRVFAIANQKGGVAKTTTAINLATSFAACGYKTLVIDMDPQANATSGLGIDSRNVGASVRDILVGEVPASKTILETQIPDLFLLPSKQTLVSAQVDLLGEDNNLARLKQAIAPIREDYDFILIDCQPSLTLLPINALTAADYLLVPLQTEYFALEGLSHIHKFLTDLQRHEGASVELYGIILTMTDNTRLSHQVQADVREAFGSKVFNTMIPRNVRLAEAPSHGMPVIMYDRTASGAVAYLELAAEILKREGLTIASA